MIICKRSALRAIVLAMVVVVMTGARPAQASLTVAVDYSTSGTFDITSPSPTFGNDTSTVLWGNGLEILSFDGTSRTNVPVPDSIAPLGTFEVFGGTFTDLSNVTGTFSLTLSETAPLHSSHTINSTISGSLAFDSTGRLTITFDSPSSFSVGNVLYTLPASISVDAPSWSHLTTTASLTANLVDPPDPPAAPEPSTLVALLSGAVPLGFWARFRRRANGRRPGP
jgi:hypothetical protein